MSIRLTIKEDYHEALRDKGLDTFKALMHGDVGKIVTRHDDRQTRMIELDVKGKTQRFYLKRVFRVDLKQSFWPLFAGKLRHSPPVHEWNAIEKLRHLNFNVPDTIASGEQRTAGMPRCGFVLLKAIDAKYNLNDWLTTGYPKPAILDEADRVQLLHAVGKVIGNLIECGYLWPDCRAKHVFAIRTDDARPDSTWRISLIDLERVRAKKFRFTNRAHAALQVIVGKGPAALTNTLKSLMPAGLLQHEIDALFRGMYGIGLFDELSAIDKIWPENHRVLIDHVYSQFGADTQPNLPDDYRHPNTLPMPKVNGLSVDTRFTEALKQLGIESFENAMTVREGRALDKPGLDKHRERVRLTTPDGLHTFYLKRFDRPPIREQLRRMREFRFRRSTAEREMHFIRHLSLLGIPTMTRVAYGRRMSGIWEKASVAVTAELPGKSLEKLVEFWLKNPKDAPGFSERRDIIDQLARVSAKMHRVGMFHRDYYLCHVFLSQRTDGKPILSLIDLGRMIRSSEFTRTRWMIKDLAALNYSSPAPLVSRADRLRFLYYYARLMSPNFHEIPTRQNREWAKRLIPKISARCEKMRRHDESRRRRFDKGN